MKWCSIVVVSAAVLQVSVNALSTDAHSTTLTDSGRDSSISRLSSDMGETNEERGILGVTALEKLKGWTTKLKGWPTKPKGWTTKPKVDKVEKKLFEKWYKSGENPQTIFAKFGYRGKKPEEIRSDPKYMVYVRYSDVWTKKLTKRGFFVTPEKWRADYDAEMKAAGKS